MENAWLELMSKKEKNLVTNKIARSATSLMEEPRNYTMQPQTGRQSYEEDSNEHCAYAKEPVQESTLIQIMDKTLQQPIRQTNDAEKGGPQEFHHLYENRLNQSSLPFLSSVDSGTSAKSQLYRVLLSHGKVDKVIDLDPYNIQAFYEQNRKAKEQQTFPFLENRIVFPAFFRSPTPHLPLPRLYHDAHQQPLGVASTTRVATKPCRAQFKVSNSKSYYRPSQATSSSNYQSSQHELPGCAHNHKSRSLASFHTDDTSGVTPCSEYDEDIEAAEESDEEGRTLSVTETGIGYALGTRQKATGEATYFYSSTDDGKIKKGRDVKTFRGKTKSFTQDPKAIAVPTTLLIAAASKARVTSTMSRSWSDAEHNAVLQELQQLRAEETRRGIARKKWCTGMGLWAKIADELRKYNLGRSRTPISVSLYWNRYGRLRSGFDERRVAEPGRMLSSTQKSKSDRMSRL